MNPKYIQQPVKAAQHDRVDGFQVPELHRVNDPVFGGLAGTNHGGFSFPSKDLSFGYKRQLVVIAHQATEDWQHVELVALRPVDGQPKYKTPSYVEMCQARLMFWDDSRVVMIITPNDLKINEAMVPQFVHLWSHIGMYPVPAEELMRQEDPDHGKR